MASTGRKLDMGKFCVHFWQLDDLPLDLIAEAIERVSKEAHTRHYQATRKSDKDGEVIKRENAGVFGQGYALSLRPVRLWPAWRVQAALALPLIALAMVLASVDDCSRKPFPRGFS